MNRFYKNSAWKIFSMSLMLLSGMLCANSIQAQNNNRNTKPTINKIPDYSTQFSTDLHFIEVYGITPGDEEDQNVTIDVSTGDKDLIESIEADLVGNGKAFISYRLRTGATGTATVKVVVTDDGEVPLSTSRTFRIVAESFHREISSNAVVLEAPNHRLKAFPNPAALSTRIYFSTPADEKRAVVDVYTISGIKVRQLFVGTTSAGASYSVDVDSRNMATGVYIVRLTGKAPIEDLRLVIAR